MQYAHNNCLFPQYPGAVRGKKSSFSKAEAAAARKKDSGNSGPHGFFFSLLPGECAHHHHHQHSSCRISRTGAQWSCASNPLHKGRRTHTHVERERKERQQKSDYSAAAGDAKENAVRPRHARSLLHYLSLVCRCIRPSPSRQKLRPDVTIARRIQVPRTDKARSEREAARVRIYL